MSGHHAGCSVSASHRIQRYRSARSGVPTARPEHGKSIREHEQDGPRLVHRDVAVAQRRHPPERIDLGEARGLVAAARVDVDLLVLRARLLERHAHGERCAARDLEELDHAVTAPVVARSRCARNLAVVARRARQAGNSSESTSPSALRPASKSCSARAP